MSFIEATIISLFKDKHVLKIEEIVFELQIEKNKLMLFIKNLVKCKLFILENINENKVSPFMSIGVFPVTLGGLFWPSVVF